MIYLLCSDRLKHEKYVKRNLSSMKSKRYII
jgi:hypothetical protein